MLILHTSDWHLGRTLHQADLTPAFQLWCDHVVDLVEDLLLVIRGDLVEVELGVLVPEDAEVVEVVEDVGLSEIALATSA